MTTRSDEGKTQEQAQDIGYNGKGASSQKVYRRFQFELSPGLKPGIHSGLSMSQLTRSNYCAASGLR